MSPDARTYTRERLKALQRVNGVAFEDRLWRNMLSSQPLAFSIVGELRHHPAAAAAVFSTLTGHDVVRFDALTDSEYPDYVLDRLDAEWFPPAQEHTGDRSGFDIAALLRLRDESRMLLTIEVKYVDSFSPAMLEPERYADHLRAVGLTRSATDELVNAGGSQFLRSVLLTDSVRRGGVRGEVRRGSGVEHALAVVLARHDDSSAKRVVKAFSDRRLPTGSGFWSHRDFFDEAGKQPALASWARGMRDRYLLHST